MDLASPVPGHADLRALPRDEAYALIAARHHLRDPHAFTTTARTHLVRVRDGKLLCGRRVAEPDLLVTGPLTCRTCIRQVAKRVHRKFRPGGSARRT